jgi:hypothetical protein
MAGAALAGLVVVTLVAGCSREKIDWKSAESADTVEAYDRFIEHHPDSELATQARARVAQLQEERDWKVATGTDTAVGYKEFLAKHTNGKWAEEARIRVESAGLEPNPSPLSVSKQPDANARATSSAAAVPGEAAAAPSPSSNASPPASKSVQANKPSQMAVAAAHSTSANAPAASIPPATPAPSGYGIQLGAFGTQDAALAAWRRLQVTHDDQLHGLFAHAVPVQTASGQLFRLQSPVGAEARARSICAALVQKSQPCVVVLPDTH